MRVIKIPSKATAISLVAGGEIPFGPLLFDLHINEASHALSKAIFLDHFVSSENGRYVVLTEYNHKQNGYITQLVLLDVQFMNYAIIKSDTALLTPVAITESEVKYEQVNEVKRIPIDTNIHWQPLIAAHDNASLVEIFKAYGYSLKTFDDKSFTLQIKHTPKVRQSLSLVATGGLGFLLSGFLTSGIFQGVAFIVAAVLLCMTAYAFFTQQLFVLTVNTHQIQKRVFVRQIFSHHDVLKYTLECEPVLRVRSTQVESYTWYLNAQLRNGKQVTLIHFNAPDKQKGLQDLLTATNLFGNVDVQADA